MVLSITIPLTPLLADKEFRGLVPVAQLGVLGDSRAAKIKRIVDNHLTKRGHNSRVVSLITILSLPETILSLKTKKLYPDKKTVTS